ncbi:MAG: hypothetical protein O2971_06555 [Proteobacteria bacterium]|nr:hypothetical protein [Pseudomonadota bacterium]
MSQLAVITGDLINSTRVENGQRFRALLKSILAGMTKKYGAKTSIYRGDGFQISLTRRDCVFEATIYLRAGLIAGSPDRAERWDARVAMALGEHDAVIEEQNSTVFIQSGRALDGMKKEHMVVVGEPESFQLAANIATAFVDDLIDNWTAVEAQTLFEYLQGRESHQAIAERLGKTRSTVTLSLQRARYNLIDRYITDMTRLRGLFVKH